MNPEKRYGLIIPKKENAVKKKTMGIASVFGGDSSDSDKDTSTDWRKKTLQEETKKAVKRQTKIDMERALAEDPTVYQYDEVYDAIDKKKTDKIAAQKKEDKKPRYIQSLMKQAEKRKQENERRNERQVQKERETEGAEFADKETFVTSSYRKKLEEFKKQEEQERRQDMLEEIGDVSKQQDLSGFYRHLYQTTVEGEEPRKPPPESKNAVSPAEDKSAEKSKSVSPVKSNHTKSTSEKPVSSSVADKENLPTEKKSRSYRKRARSKSSSGSEEEVASDKHSKTKRGRSKENIDADTSASSSDENEEDGSEEGEIIDKESKEKRKQVEEDKETIVKRKSKDDNHDSSKQKKKAKDGSSEDKNEEMNLEDKVKSSLDKILEEKKKHLEQLIREEEEREKENGDESSEDEKEGEKEEEKEEKPKKKVNIWEKRTVGEVFDAALQRYLERKATREAAKG